MISDIKNDNNNEEVFSRENLNNLKKSKKEEAKKLKNEKFEKKKKIEIPNSTTINKKNVKNTTKVLYTYVTNIGDKKNVECTIPDSYHPSYVESIWYDWWVKEGFFKPEYKYDIDKIKSMDITSKLIVLIPPPNVTGTLHLGHALMCSIQDAIVRWRRMQGKVVLWNPGCDHAGIATQVVVEKKLKRERNISRHEIGREEFIKEVWKWKNEKGHIITQQMKKMGISVDWSREFFTMDVSRSKAVEEAFIRLFQKNYIYRSKRLVNWSCHLNSAISDIEVDKVEITGRQLLSVPGYDYKVEFGVIIQFKYLIESTCQQYITVATTRIETMLGDTAIAVHPNDERYTNYIGKYAIHPFCNRKLKIISDDSIDMTFGTGAVKITPAHDQNDYEIGIRHNLDMINIFTDDGKIVTNLDIFDEYKKYIGMARFECRHKIIEDLKKLDLFVSKCDHNYIIPICNRSKDIVEPVLRSQWYIDCKEMSKNACNVVRNGDLKIKPNIYEKTWYSWMENIQDWCISRQLWWGHRIPAYYVTSKYLPESNPDYSKYWVCGYNYEDALNKACIKFNLKSDDLQLKQDEDVLDTWFSSGILPFSIFDWPNNTDSFSAFYPTSILETGYDILFFWVARMVMLSLTLTDSLPFQEVLLHPIVRDSHGRKMSKSLGNIIDPLDVIHGISLEDLHNQLTLYNLDSQEFDKAKKSQTSDFPIGIPECGTDALRFALCIYSSTKKDINLDVLRIQGYRFFCNKIWNAVKFSLPHMIYCDYQQISDKSYNDMWILSRLDFTIQSTNESFENFELSSSCTHIYNFWLYDFCDIYLEAIKPILQSGTTSEIKSIAHTLFVCIDNGLRLIHPFMPYLSEELYQRLPFPSSHFKNIPSICVSSYPTQISSHDPSIESEYDCIKTLVNLIRSTKDTYVPSKTKVDVYILTHSEKCCELFTKYYLTIKTLSNSLNLYIHSDVSLIPKGCAISLYPDMCHIHVMFRGSIDLNKEISKTHDKIDKTQQSIQKLTQFINSPGYSIKVPNDVQISNETKLIQLNDELVKLQNILDCFNLKE